MTPEAWLTLAGVWMLAVATPGPNVAFTVATGLSTPRPTAFLAAVGIGLGAIIYALAALSGLGALLYASPTAFTAVKWLGVAYLVWLGIKALYAPKVRQQNNLERIPTRGPWLVFRGFAIMMSNPKAVLAVGAIIPPFIEPTAPALPQFAVIAATVAFGSVAVHCFYIAIAGRIARWRMLIDRPSLAHYVSAVIYLLAAAALAVVGI